MRYSRSHEPLSRLATNHLSFQQLYGELKAAFQLHKKLRIVTLRDEASESIREKKDTVVGVNYAQLRRYSGRPKMAERGSKSHHPLSISGCFNCDAHSQGMPKAV